MILIYYNYDCESDEYVEFEDEEEGGVGKIDPAKLDENGFSNQETPPSKKKSLYNFFEDKKKKPNSKPPINGFDGSNWASA